MSNRTRGLETYGTRKKAGKSWFTAHVPVGPCGRGDILPVVFPVHDEYLMMPSTAQTESERGASTYSESKDQRARLEEQDTGGLGRPMLWPPGWKCMASPGALHLRTGTQMGGERESGDHRCGARDKQPFIDLGQKMT